MVVSNVSRLHTKQETLLSDYMIQKIQLNPWSDNLLKQKKTQDIYLQNGTEDELSNDEKMKLMKFCGSAKNCFLFIDKKKLN